MTFILLLLAVLIVPKIISLMYGNGVRLMIEVPLFLVLLVTFPVFTIALIVIRLLANKMIEWVLVWADAPLALEYHEEDES